MLLIGNLKFAVSKAQKQSVVRRYSKNLAHTFTASKSMFGVSSGCKITNYFWKLTKLWHKFFTLCMKIAQTVRFPRNNIGKTKKESVWKHSLFYVLAEGEGFTHILFMKVSVSPLYAWSLWVSAYLYFQRTADVSSIFWCTFIFCLQN